MISTATTWALFAISKDKSIQAKLRDALFSVDTENPTMDELNSITYLEHFVRETVRSSTLVGWQTGKLTIRFISCEFTRLSLLPSVSLPRTMSFRLARRLPTLEEKCKIMSSKLGHRLLT